MMHEDELRAMVREAVARHLGPASMDAVARPPEPWKQHMSHGRFAILMTPTPPDTPCIVEPSVRCHHCGFCQSYGH